MNQNNNFLKSSLNFVAGIFNRNSGKSRETFNVYNSFDSFLFICNQCMKKIAGHTDVEISFSKHFSFGASMERIISLIGTPKYIYEREELNLSIMLYIISIKGHKVKFELHFYDNKLFCVNYAYKYLSNADRMEILESLKVKYRLNKDEYMNKLILDDAGNGLIIDETETLTVNYVSPSARVFSLSESYINKLQKAI